MKHFIRPIGILVVSLVFLTLGYANAAEIPSPAAGVNIKPPAPDLPSNLAAFSGTWEGYWGGILPSRLVVEEIYLDKAIVVYAWGDHPQGRFRGGWTRVTAKVLPGGAIEWGGGERSKFTFTMGKDFKAIDGKREFRDQVDRVTMTRKAP